MMISARFLAALFGVLMCLLPAGSRSPRSSRRARHRAARPRDLPADRERRPGKSPAGRLPHPDHLAREQLSRRRRSARPAPRGSRNSCRGRRSERGLADPFDPEQAIPKAAALLADLRRRFGNLGVAAAAYNAGPARVASWLRGEGELPRGDAGLCPLCDRATARQDGAAAGRKPADFDPEPRRIAILRRG